MGRFFVSYSRADTRTTTQIIGYLRRSYDEHDFWYDEDINGSEDWWTRILDEIHKADFFVYLVSNKSLKSRYCQAEFREALRLQKTILPLLLIRHPDFDFFPEDIRDKIKAIQAIDISRKGIKDSNKAAELNKSVNKLLKDPPSQTLPPLDPEPVARPKVPDTPNRRLRLRALGTSAALLLAMLLIALYILLTDNGKIPYRLTITPAHTYTPTFCSPGNPVESNDHW